MKRLATSGVLVLLLGTGLCLWLVRLRPGRSAAEPAPPPESRASQRPTVKPAAPDPALANPATGGPANALARHPAAAQEASHKRAWDPEFLASLRQAAEGDRIQFELTEGQMASGLIKHLDRTNNQVRYVSGLLARPEAGRFFFQRQTLPGVAGEFVGVVEFPASRRAWRIEPTGPGGGSELVERTLGDVICLKLPRPDAEADPEEIPPLKPDDSPVYPVPAYQEGIAVLESLPGAPAVIYLDFRGGYTPTWNGVTYDRPAMSNAQIRDVWTRVAEDFMPFTINVTTDLKVYQGAAENCRQRIVITPTATAAPETGGVSYEGSFNWTGDVPCWVFITNDAKMCADACSHEAGHALNLRHMGRDADGTHTEYFGGQGEGETGWAPIMGLPYYHRITQWSRGEYRFADNPQDQLDIILSQNNQVRYRLDDTGDTLVTARYLEIYSDANAGAEGVIETTGDGDAFQFTTAGGAVCLRADPVSASPNLALEVALYDAHDQLLLSSAPATTLGAALAAHLPGGTFTFRVSGAGRNDPRTNGFSAYGSLGYYSITGTVAQARLPDRFTIGEHAPNGTKAGVVAANHPYLHPLRYAITSGNSNGAFAIDNTGALSVADSAMLDYETLARQTQLPAQFELFVDIVDPLDPAGTETHRRVTVAVTQVNRPPAIAGFSPSDGGTNGMGAPAQFTTSIVEHLPPGTLVCQVMGSDPDAHTVLSYAITAGNRDGMFRIDEGSGAIFVVGDPTASVQNLYPLTVAVSDQTPPTPLTTECTVTIRIQLPYARGGIGCAVYTNIIGTMVADLTRSASFPGHPGWVGRAAHFELDSRPEANCGAAMRGYVLPPTSGDYTFWIASQDNGELWLSTSTHPAGMTLIASIRGEGEGTGPREWAKYPTQRSVPITLPAGYAYYVEARMKAGGESNHLAVAWECAGAGIAQEVIPGEYLAPYAINYAPQVVGFAAALHRDAMGGSRIGTVAIVDFNATDIATLAIASGNEEGIFSLEPTTGIIRLASAASLLTSGRTPFVLDVRATDNGSPPLSGAANVTIDVVPDDAITTLNIREEIWTGIGPGDSVAEFLAQPRFPNRPDGLRKLTDFDAGGSILGANYGSRIRACLIPTNTGAYTFFIASGGGSQLRLSPTAHPAEAAVIASVPNGADTEDHAWDGYGSQPSGPRWLVAGQAYYLEALRKTAGGRDHLAVGWTGPGLSGTNPITSPFLAPVDLGYAPVLDDVSVRCPLMATNGSLVAVLTASDSALDTLAYRIISGNLSNTFQLDPVSGQLTVADRTLIVSETVTNFHLEVRVQDSGYGGLYPLRSSTARVTVAIVDNSPPVVWSGNGPDANWSTAGNWISTLPVNNRKLVFTGANHQTNRNDLLTAVGRVTLARSGFRLEGNPLVLKGPLFSSGNNTWAIDSIFNDSQTMSNGAGTLVVSGAVRNDGKTLTLRVNDETRFEGALSGSGGIVVAGIGRLVMSANNTYTGPTLINSGTLALTHGGTISRSPTIGLGGLVNPGPGGGGIVFTPGTVFFFPGLDSSPDSSAGAMLDVSGTSAIFTVPAGQTLTGQGEVLGDAVILGTLAPLSGMLSGTAVVTNKTLVTTYPYAMTFRNNLVLAGNTAMNLTATFGFLDVGFGNPLAYTNVVYVFGNQAIEATPFGTWPWMGGIRAMGGLVCGGTLTITTAPGFAPSDGDTFQLFDAPRLGGAFARLSLPALRGGLEWDIRGLMVDGTLKVCLAPPRIVPILSPGGLSALSLPTAAGASYVVEWTRSLQPPARWTPWTTNLGTGGPMRFSLPKDRAQPQRFFRVEVLPQTHGALPSQITDPVAD